MRDAKVVLSAFADLRSGEAGQLDAELLDRIETLLKQRRAELIPSIEPGVGPAGRQTEPAPGERAPAAAPPLAESLAPAAQTLEAAWRRSKRWPVAGAGWLSIAKGVDRVYGAGREAMAGARRNPSVEHLHEWRKQAKYLRSELTALEPIRPKLLRPWIEMAYLIGDHLGDNHDLALLAGVVSERFSDSPDSVKLLAFIDQRRDRLASQAMTVGRELYRLKPKAFVARLRRPWRARLNA